jgi:hypothetical protein
MKQDVEKRKRRQFVYTLTDGGQVVIATKRSREKQKRQLKSRIIKAIKEYGAVNVGATDVRGTLRLFFGNPSLDVYEAKEKEYRKLLYLGAKWGAVGGVKYAVDSQIRYYCKGIPEYLIYAVLLKCLARHLVYVKDLQRLKVKNITVKGYTYLSNDFRDRINLILNGKETVDKSVRSHRPN